ncbi:MAG: hypothetical protein H7122_07680 [Chitinophagaceae bacterium]|nr:hypothetical protein [Chitinophagaceae bacterium]
MDTDNLSDEAYRGIFIEAERFNHTLTLRFGVLAYSCKNETEYLEEARQLIDYLRKAKESSYPDIFFDEIPRKIALLATLDNISANISAIEMRKMS